MEMNALLFGYIGRDIEPNRQMFTRVLQNLAEPASFTATMQDTGRQRTPILEEGLLHRNPESSMRSLTAATGKSRSTV